MHKHDNFAFDDILLLGKPPCKKFVFFWALPKWGGGGVKKLFRDNISTHVHMNKVFSCLGWCRLDKFLGPHPNSHLFSPLVKLCYH